MQEGNIMTLNLLIAISIPYCPW